MNDTTAAAKTFKNHYNYHCINNNIVVFSVPSRVYRRCFGGDSGFNTFVVCADEDNIVDTNCSENYKLCERQRFRFRQFRPIYTEADSDNGLRIVPYVNGISYARLDFLHFVTNFLDCFAEINNNFRYTERRTFNTIKTLKIYRKIK
ncbi:asb074 [Agrotis segetum nucleopolyhedrovirus B]|uniref:Asb074 n=1 Tax=Agrotis segetum nucleopolyhedrovirus B TaxID=1580580 RepID=A0A0A7KTE1_9ABAC|nr:asb074 [Agrotis segetum nucleopolyhedrovirus B]AIZ48631.1 asb074 [Agrotis segetum nucleopolyhedrovirus B]